MPAPQRKADGDAMEVKSNGYGGLATNLGREQTFGLFHHHNGTIGDGNKVQANNIDWTAAIPLAGFIMVDAGGSGHTAKAQLLFDARTNNWTWLISTNS